MPEKPPALVKPDRHYDFRAMNVAFAVSSLALLAVTLWMIFADYAQPWKRLQAEFRDRERQQASDEAAAERQRIEAEEVAAIERDIAEQTARLAAQRSEIGEIEDRLGKAGAKVYELDADWRTTKSYLDTARYQYEQAVQSGDEAAIAARRARAEELRRQWEEDKAALEEVTRLRDEVEAELAARRADLDAAEKRLAALEEGLTNLQRRIANLSKGVDYFVLNAPLLDFVEPTLKIEQVILDGLYLDINFTNVSRVDRCLTCHVAANRPGFAAEDAPADDPERWRHPFQSHPRLDLFVGDSSPHPYNRFGCTICHAGLDRATNFARAGHSPASEEEREHWEREWDWEPQKYLDTPILPRGTAEAGCLGCHAGEIWTPGAEYLEVGRQLITRTGCYGCHKIDYPAFTGLRPPGPSLRRVAAKTTPGWAYRWIAAPRDFRPTTWMPHFFFQENIQGEVNLERQKAEIAAIVAYLWDLSETPAYPPPPAGDPGSGEELFETVGCTGCHIRDAEARRDDFYPQYHRLHGPNLIRAGSKVAPGWLYAWLLNPQQYFPDTNMPRLRLSEAEAADLTAFLLASRDPDFEGLEVPPVDGEIRDGLVLGYLQANYTIARSQELLAGMSDRERDVYLGKETITKYGCFSCHDIEGFQEAKPIGTELTEEGSKPVHQFDFGHVHEVPHTRHDWILTKLLEPRIWDHGKEAVKDYGELYKMPDFGMSEREARAVLANVLGFTKESVVAERQAGRRPETAALAAGRRLATRYNCRGCHLLEGEGRAIAAVMPRDLLPPNLAAEGARVQGDWLFSFLHDPGQVSLRPWLTVRMPTFDFSDEEANALVAYFSALEERAPFLSPMRQAEARDLAVGEVVFTMLQCARCHPAGPQAAQAAGAAANELAPSLLLARERLRWDWVPAWIKDPQRWIPGTNMPTNFPENGDGTYSSPLEFVFDTPMFQPRKQALARYFDSEAELKAYLTDVDRVTAALRDHIWTLR